MQQQLAVAQSKIAELQGMTKFGEPQADLARVSPFDAKCADGPMRYSHSAIMQSGHATAINNSWSSYDDSRSDTSDALSATGFNRARHIWNGPKPNQPSSMSFVGAEAPGNATPWNIRGANADFAAPGMPYNPMPGSELYRNPDRITPDYDMTIRGPNSKRSGRFDRFGIPVYGNHGPYGGGGNFNQFGQGPYDSTPNQNSQYATSTGPYSNHQPNAIGTPLSPLATEFTSGTGPWKTEVIVFLGFRRMYH